jgi:DNA-directed RNA polymerase subunit RPC12/RpoP
MMMRGLISKMPIITIKAYKCIRCGYIWSSNRHDTKKHLPHACAKCKSSYWNTPRVLPPKNKDKNNKHEEDEAPKPTIMHKTPTKKV